MSKYEFQIITGDSAPFAGDSGWGAVANALTKAAEHLESRGYEVVSIQVVNHHFGLVFYKKRRAARGDCVMEDDENVVKFDAAPVSVRRFPERKKKRYDRSACTHRATVIDEDLRTIECGACGVILDPVNVLLEISKHWGEYAAAQMGKELQSFRSAAWYLRQNEMRERRTTEDRNLNHDEITKRHNEVGCPPDRMLITNRYLECYCGVSVSRVHHRELERKALAAQNPIRKILGLAPTPPAKGPNEEQPARIA